MSIMGIEQASMRIVGVGGTPISTGWMRAYSIPAGIQVEVVELGYRVSIIATRGTDEVTLTADLDTSDAAQKTNLPNGDPLVRFARTLLAHRMWLESDIGPLKEATTGLRPLVEIAGAEWIRTDLEADGPEEGA
jgi:hypothetical protein